MKETNIKNAFGTTPQSFRDQVNRTLEQLEDKPMKRRYKFTTILAAALIAALMGTAAVAAYEGRIKEFYQNEENHLSNETAMSGIQALHESYEGNTVRCTVQEALYDGEGGTFALSWELENLTGDHDLYVVCDGTDFDGEPGGWRGTSFVSEFFLPEGSTVATCMGELPDNNANHCALSLSILRPTGPYEEDGHGYVEVDPKYLGNADDEILYSDALLAQGNFELADRFTLRFDLDMDKLGSTARHLVGNNDYKFDGYELNVTFGEITATRARIVVEYISDTEIKDGGKGLGPYYDIDFIIPGGDIWWAGNSGGSFGDPEQLPDGRWRSVYDWEAVQLFTQPDELQMVLTTYPDKNGAQDWDHPIVHYEDAVTLRFE